MTNEIKEKIEYLKKITGIYEGARITEIEDYITNLQEDLANYVNVVLHNRKVIDNLQQRIEKTIEYIEDIIERFPKLDDKELISNRLVDIECIEKLFDILRGDE